MGSRPLFLPVPLWQARPAAPGRPVKLSTIVPRPVACRLRPPSTVGTLACLCASPAGLSWLDTAESCRPVRVLFFILITAPNHLHHPRIGHRSSTYLVSRSASLRFCGPFSIVSRSSCPLGRRRKRLESDRLTSAKTLLSSTFVGLNIPSLVRPQTPGWSLSSPIVARLESRKGLLGADQGFPQHEVDPSYGRDGLYTQHYARDYGHGNAQAYPPAANPDSGLTQPAYTQPTYAEGANQGRYAKTFNYNQHDSLTPSTPTASTHHDRWEFVKTKWSAAFMGVTTLQAIICLGFEAYVCFLVTVTPANAT